MHIVFYKILYFSVWNRSVDDMSSIQNIIDVVALQNKQTDYMCDFRNICILKRNVIFFSFRFFSFNKFFFCGIKRGHHRQYHYLTSKNVTFNAFMLPFTILLEWPRCIQYHFYCEQNRGWIEFEQIIFQHIFWQ